MPNAEGETRQRVCLRMIAPVLLVMASGLAACGRSDPAVTDAAGAEATDETARKLGLPANGPEVLYQPPPDLPQLQNRDARFRAAPLMVSGAERYIEGEYQYTDFVYDDEATTYPDDFERYAGNAGDLFEFRLSTRDPNSLGFRFTMNTLMVPDSSILTVAFDSDNNPDTGSNTLPRDPGMPFPGTDQVLTTWGTGAEWSSWNGSSWVTVPLEVKTDLEANQITVTVPKSVANPTGEWRSTLATGLYDSNTGGWLATAPSPSSASRIVNLGFRFDEVAPAPPRTDLSDGAPYDRQDAALAAAEPTQFAHPIDFDLLRSRGARDNVPTHGIMYRIHPSRMKTVLAATDGDPAKGNPRLLGEGKDKTSLHGRYLSPLQPYALYVPSAYDGRQPVPTTFWLHPDSGNYYWLNEGGSHAAKLLGEDRNGIVLSPSGRGISGYYVGHLEYDVLEAWADVARHYKLDPKRTATTGYSMGAHGSYRLALLHPHLFAAAAPIAVPMCRGMWLTLACTTTEDTVLARWTENARNVPIFHLADTLSETTFYPGQLQFVLGQPLNGFNSLDSLGYRYKFWSVAIEHLLIGNNYPQIAEFLDQHPLEPEPFHVTYARMPSSDMPEIGLVHDRAYWLSGIEVRDASGALAKGVIDAVSLGFGKSDPGSSQSITAGMTEPQIPGVGWPYVEVQRVWGETGTVPVENRIKIKATNIGSVTIRPKAARVDCKVKLDVESDGPVEIRLLGCR